MKAWICKDWGPPDSLELGNVEEPEPGPDQVVLEVYRAAVNFPDTLMVAGKYQVKPPRPFVPGIECSGRVISIGTNVTGFNIGDRVTSILDKGGFAERAAADAIQTFRIPDAMSDDDSAAFPTAYGTAYRALIDRGRLRAGETLLVLGAAGGVGLCAVEIGARVGARVIAAASTERKLELTRRYGASETILTPTEPIHEKVRHFTLGQGANVVFDPVGGDEFDQSLRCMAREGRLLIIGFASGRIPSAPANRLLMAETELIGVLYGGRRTPAKARSNFAVLLQWYLSGQLKPHISGTFDFDQVPQAMQSLLERRAMGKVLVKVKD